MMGVNIVRTANTFISLAGEYQVFLSTGALIRLVNLFLVKKGVSSENVSSVIEATYGHSQKITDCADVPLGKQTVSAPMDRFYINSILDNYVSQHSDNLLQRFDSPYDMVFQPV